MLEKLNEFYSEILLTKSRHDPRKKRSLKGLMLQRTKEKMENGGWRLVSPPSKSPCRVSWGDVSSYRVRLSCACG